MDNKYYILEENPLFAVDQLTEPKYLKTLIGDSSYGWKFKLFLYPKNGINSFEDWAKLIESGLLIINEKIEFINSEEMIDIITKREKYALIFIPEFNIYNCHRYLEIGTKVLKSYLEGKDIPSDIYLTNIDVKDPQYGDPDHYYYNYP